MKPLPIAILLLACSPVAAADLPRATPESQGIPSAAVLDFIDAADKTSQDRGAVEERSHAERGSEDPVITGCFLGPRASSPANSSSRIRCVAITNNVLDTRPGRPRTQVGDHSPIGIHSVTSKRACGLVCGLASDS